MGNTEIHRLESTGKIHYIKNIFTKLYSEPTQIRRRREDKREWTTNGEWEQVEHVGNIY